MFRLIHSPSVPVTLVGGGQATPQLVKTALRHAPVCVAADGGAVVAMKAGVMPDAVIGDFDSLPGVVRNQIPPQRLHPDPDQDTTDFEKCLAAVETSLVLGVGFLGKRMDHTLASYTAMLKDPRPIVLVSEEELCFIAPERFAAYLPEGMRIGLYPLLATRMTTMGLRYPLEDAEVAPNGLISTSNHVQGDVVELWSDARSVLVILPLEALESVLVALGAV